MVDADEEGYLLQIQNQYKTDLLIFLKSFKEWEPALVQVILKLCLSL
jgi:hypothetical protein